MALETTALDLRGRQQHLSGAAMLGADPCPERPLAWLVGAPDACALETIWAVPHAGYMHLKIKMGNIVKFDTEAAAVRKLRPAIGAGPRIYLILSGFRCKPATLISCGDEQTSMAAWRILAV